MTASTVLDGEAAVRAAANTVLGTTDWYTVTEAQLAAFAEATGDPEATYFAVSLSNMFLPQIVEVRGFTMGINYGTEAVVLNGVPRADDRLRAMARMAEVTDVRGGIQTRISIAVECETTGVVCTIESLSRWLHG
jgi:acyl dehydratase